MAFLIVGIITVVSTIQRNRIRKRRETSRKWMNGWIASHPSVGIQLLNAFEKFWITCLSHIRIIRSISLCHCCIVPNCCSFYSMSLIPTTLMNYCIVVTECICTESRGAARRNFCLQQITAAQKMDQWHTNQAIVNISKVDKGWMVRCCNTGKGKICDAIMEMLKNFPFLQ